jgi:hypothetical protein
MHNKTIYVDFKNKRIEAVEYIPRDCDEDGYLRLRLKRYAALLGCTVRDLVKANIKEIKDNSDAS